MKFLAITLLAVCLIQGNNAQFGGLRNLVSNAASSAVNAATGAANAASGVANAASIRASDVLSGAVNAATGAANAASGVAIAASGVANAASSRASGVLSGALNAASSIRNNLSGGAQALIDSAAADVSIDSLTEAANNLSPNDLLQTVNGAADEVKTIVSGIQSQLEATVNSVTEKAKASLSSATSSWNSPVKAAVEKAVAAGVDVKDCAVDGVADLAKDSVGSAVKCVTDKVKEAVTLVKNIANLPVRATVLATDATTGLNTCRKRTNTILKRTCQVTTVAPIAVKSALLVKDAVSYATQATTLVTTIQSQLTTCAAGVAAKSGVQAAATGGKIISCVRSKLTN